MEYLIKDSRYKLIEGSEINGGGFNKIFECSLVDEEDKVINDNLVLKRLKNDLDLHQIWRLDREMRYIEKLNHENILKPYYCDYDEGFIVMERYPMNLHDYLERDELMGGEYLKVFSDILSGVKYYISEGVLHRDLKPHNILINHDNKVKITDFGLSSRIERDRTLQHLTQLAQAGGTHFFGAPEQLERLENSDERSDIYSLGKIFYVLVTRDLDYHDMKLEAVEPQLRYVIKKATKYNPDERFQNVDDLIKSFNMIYKPETDVSFKDYQLDSIIKEINSEIRKEEKSHEKLQRIFEHISNPEYIDVVDLMVKLDVDTHRVLWEIDSDSYSDFMRSACASIEKAGFIFSYVDTIVSSTTSILDELKTNLDIELQAQIVASSVFVSTDHNRYWAMEVIAEYISEIKSPFLLENLRSGECALGKDVIEKLSHYHKSDTLKSLVVLE